jgi:hypothetical protein
MGDREVSENGKTSKGKLSIFAFFRRMSPQRWRIGLLPWI